MSAPDSKDKALLRAAERRQLTVVFIDIVDSTPLSERLDPEDFFFVLRTYREICDQSIRNFGGHIARMVGDGLLAYFGHPSAHEDDAERAVRAGLSIVTAIREHEFSTSEVGSIRLQVRIGVNTGLVVVGSVTDGPSKELQEVFGTPAHLAARLQAIAPPNGLVIGPDTYDLVRGAFRCRSQEAQKLKGLKEPIPIWQVEGLEQSESRFERKKTAPLTLMVGRENESAALLKLWQNAVAGSGEVAVICGEPGIGKSRLIQNLRTALAGMPNETLYFQCSPLQSSTPLAPLVEQTRRAAGLDQHDSAAEMVAKVRRLLMNVQPEFEAAVGVYCALMSIPISEHPAPVDLRSPVERSRALDVVVNVSAGLSRRWPVLMIIEDVQWIDPTSIELLQRLLPRIARERILLILTHRSDYEPHWLDGHNIHTIPLSKLNESESEQIIRDVLGDEVLPRNVLRKIIERTDGIPLFVEEFTRAVRHSKLQDDQQLSGRHLSEPIVPASISDSLMERLDRLGDAKQVAQVASIFGRQFELEELSELLDLSEGEVCGAVHRLETENILYRRKKTQHTTFIFKHAMIQELAYASLLKEARTALHARVASRLERLSSNGSGQELAILGYHYSRAGMFPEAIGARLKAGQEALARSAVKEAVANLQNGIELLSKLPPSSERFQAELALQSNLAMAYTALAGWAGPEVDKQYGRALELSRSYGTVREKSIVLWGVSIAKLVNTELVKSLELSLEFIQLADEWRNDEASLMARTAALLANFFLGRLPEALILTEEVCERYNSETHSTLVRLYQHDPKVVALVYAGHIHWLLGHPGDARASCDAARRLARSLGHPFMLAFALILGSCDHLYERDLDANLKCVEEGVTLAKEHSLWMYEVFGPLWATPAIAARDKSDLDELDKRLTTLLDYHCYLQAPLYQVLLATEFAHIDQLERARSLASAAEQLLRQTGERWLEPEIHRVSASLCCMQPEADDDRAAELFRCALASAKALKAPGWELRAALTFSRFLDERGRRAEAFSLLTQARGTFPAGESSFDTRQADHLLQSWGPSQLAQAI
jgi:class 3 adenylate cyclase/predicted ATPase